MKIEMTQIGVVRNGKKEACSPEEIKAERSVIIIEAAYRAGLRGLWPDAEIEVVFYLHKNEDEDLEKKNRYGETCGVFASRWPSRPNHIGVTRCRVAWVDEESGEIAVDWLDAIDESPVLDIKGNRMR